MYEFIKGKLIQARPIMAIVETNNIGYKVFIPVNCFSKLPQIGKEVFFYTSLIIREDAHTIYGFLSQDQRDLFEQLINSVSGIGPKNALALIGHLEMDHFHSAIATSDIKMISKVPGIGKKTAERMIIEMKDKLKIFNDLTSSNTKDKTTNNASYDAIKALLNLGYNALNAKKAINKALEENPDHDVSSLISSAIRKM
jgi:holliday junction DNA helicase RuvA